MSTEESATIVDNSRKNSENPKLKKLGQGGEIYAWLTNIELHFKGNSLWTFVKNERSQTTIGSEEKKLGSCMRDTLLVLTPGYWAWNVYAY